MPNCKTIEISSAGALKIQRNGWREPTYCLCPFNGKDCRIGCPLFEIENVIVQEEVRVKSVTLCSGIKWEAEEPGVNLVANSMKKR